MSLFLTSILIKWFPLISTFSMLFYAWILNNIDNFVKSPFTIIMIKITLYNNYDSCNWNHSSGLKKEMKMWKTDDRHWKNLIRKSHSWAKNNSRKWFDLSFYNTSKRKSIWTYLCKKYKLLWYLKNLKQQSFELLPIMNLLIINHCRIIHVNWMYTKVPLLGYTVDTQYYV